MAVKHGSIRTKILWLVLLASLSTAVLFGVISVAGMVSMRETSRRSNAELARISAEESAAALILQAQNQLQTLANDLARLIDERAKTRDIHDDNAMREDIVSLAAMQVGERGYMLLLDENGTIVYPEKESGDLAISDIRQSENQELAEIGKAMYNGANKVAEAIIDDELMIVAYCPAKSIGWSVGALISRNEVIAPAMETSGKVNETADATLKALNKAIFNVVIAVLSMLAFISAAVSLFAMKVSNRMTGPLITLTKGAREINGGNLSLQFDIRTNDEIELLAESFNQMASELSAYMKNLTEAVAERERMETELNIAAQIQLSMLPNKLAAFPCRNKFTVNASMHAAREVGGDFYDFFMVDDDHLAVVIADVSGKGIPAALFMVITKSLIKNYAQEGHSPAEVFKVVNNQLCENNEAGMFVTAFMGILEISTSRFICINAGHVPPLLDAGDGFMRFEISPGFVLGAFEDMNFPTQERTLKPKSRLFLCTDGIGEAANERDELFTDERLCNLLNSEQAATLRGEQALERVAKEISDFAGETEQADDITMLFLELL